MPSKSQKIQHLYNRAGFGLSIEQFYKRRKSRVKKESKQLLKGGVTEVPLVVFPENPFLKLGPEFNKVTDRKELNKAFSEKVKETRNEIKELNSQWMKQLTRPDTMVREKLVLFWHDHFAVRTGISYHAQLHNNILRKYALGKYRDLLLAVSKDPGMLQFLNNQQNNKRKPNENFARELLELFTLGRGHYSEKDIKHAAKAFTGWKYDRFSCQFRFVDRQHDKTEKEFMGHSGDLGGEDIIDIVLANKQTAFYLSAKLFQYYVSDQPDKGIIQRMADRLFKSDYDIGDLLGYIFQSDWFYEERFLNNKIKSPQELLHGVHLHFGLKYDNPKALMYLQFSLGQRLFYPPGVNGWSVGREWVNSSSLVNRMSLIGLLAKNAELGIRIKEDLDSDKAKTIKGSKKLLITGRMNWSEIEKRLNGLSEEKAIDLLAGFLINQPLSTEHRKAILIRLRKQKGKNTTKWLAVTIASLPEYQLA